MKKYIIIAAAIIALGFSIWGFLSIKSTTVSKEVDIFTAKEFDASMMDTYDAFAFGCPASGIEQLELIEFEPMFKECLPKLKAKHISLFGSYGWGDGQWMRDWEETCLSHGADVVHDYVICVETPDGETLEACRHMGEALAMLP
jgi:flavodoxin